MHKLDGIRAQPLLMRIAISKFLKKRVKGCQRGRSSDSFSCVTRAFFCLLFFHSLFATSVRADSLFKPDGTCARSFIYRNRSYPVDSSRKLDGEGMRFVLKKSSQAETLLNDYQSRLKSSFAPAYVSTAGILIAITGPLYASSLKLGQDQKWTRLGTIIGGVFLAVGGYAYGQYALNQKEKTLEKAVETYNDAVPEPERVRIDLMPLPTGSGGEIKTQVPF